MKRRASLAAFGLCLGLGAMPASAEPLPCTPVEPDVIYIDGLLSDWQSVEPVRLSTSEAIDEGKEHWSGPDDLSVDLYCNYHDRALYLAFTVRDDYFIGSGEASLSDHLIVTLGRDVLELVPGDRRNTNTRAMWYGRSRRGPSQVKGSEGVNAQGYQFEVEIPWKEVRAYRVGQAALKVSLTVVDRDSKAKPQIMTRLEWPHRQIAFAEQQANLAAFLESHGYSAKQIRIRKDANVVGKKRQEQVVVIDKTLAVIGPDLKEGDFFFFSLPIEHANEFKELILRDLDGDDRNEMIVRYEQRRGELQRGLLSIYRFDHAEHFVHVLTQEIMNKGSERSVGNRVIFQPQRGRRAKGIDLVIEGERLKSAVDEEPQAQSDEIWLALPPSKKPKQRRFRFQVDGTYQASDG